MALESVARRYGVRSGRTRSNEDQQAIYPGDTIFKFTAPSTAKSGAMWWGRKSQRSKYLSGGGSSGNGVAGGGGLHNVDSLR